MDLLERQLQNFASSGQNNREFTRHHHNNRYDPAADTDHRLIFDNFLQRCTSARASTSSSPPRPRHISWNRTFSEPTESAQPHLLPSRPSIVSSLSTNLSTIHHSLPGLSRLPSSLAWKHVDPMLHDSVGGTCSTDRRAATPFDIMHERPSIGAMVASARPVIRHTRSVRRPLS